MKNKIMQYFKYGHLITPLNEISKSICELAEQMNDRLPHCAEKFVGLRKLLEAKDCFVRAKLTEEQEREK